MAVMSMPRPRVGTVMIDALKLSRRQSRDDELPPGWVEEDGIIVPFWHSKARPLPLPGRQRARGPA